MLRKRNGANWICLLGMVVAGYCLMAAGTVAAPPPKAVAGPAKPIAPGPAKPLVPAPMSISVSADLEGFTEPYRTINVAAEDMGTIEEVAVREGESVKVGQPLARLNSAVQRALLAIAEQNVKSEGRLDAAMADLRLRKDRLQKLEPLRVDGYARQEEVDRAVAEVAVAEANLRTAREDLVAKQLECERIKAQIACRTVRSPVAGVVTKVHKQMGEFVAPNNPDVMTLVEIDRLTANFTLSAPQATKLRRGQELTVHLSSEAPAVGVVDFISPVTNAESGTVLVKLRIDNADGRYRSGDRCRIRLAE